MIYEFKTNTTQEKKKKKSKGLSCPVSLPAAARENTKYRE
jgi:hypothetical protein